MSVTSELKTVGLKATMPRVKVLEIFHSDEQRHLTAEDVYKRLSGSGSDIGLGTVYRVLAQLTEVGILVRSVFDADAGKAIYELHGDAPHDHLICMGCGRVDEFMDAELAAQQRSVAEHNGYALAQHQLVLYGYCASCRRRRSASRS